MRMPKLGRPSPALVVAVAALFIALGGTAVAANKINGNLLKPKSVGGGKLKQFTGGLLKKQSVGGGKIKKDTLTSFQIDEDRLGTVPSARSIEGDSRYSVKLGFGQAQQLATSGSLALVAQCLHNTTDTEGKANRDVARILVTTGETNSVFSGSAGSKSGDGSGFLNPTTPDGERIAVEYSVPTGSGQYMSGGSVTAYAPSGAGIVLPQSGNAASVNLFGAPCVFQGAAFQA